MSVAPDIDSDAAVGLHPRDLDLRIDRRRLPCCCGGPRPNVFVRHRPTGLAVAAHAAPGDDAVDLALRALRGQLYLLGRSAEEGRPIAPPGAGARVRDYAADPKPRVVDAVSGFETGDLAAVLEGDLDPFIEAALSRRQRVEAG